MKYNRRNKRSIIGTLVMVFLLALTSAVAAQDAPPDDQPGDQAENQGQNSGQEELLLAPAFGSGLLAYDVIGQNGNLIGDVGGIVLDTATGQVQYLVIESDNLLNDTDALVPWGAFRVVSDRAGVDVDAADEAENGALDDTGEAQTDDGTVASDGIELGEESESAEGDGNVAPEDASQTPEPNTSLDRSPFDPLRDIQLMLNVSEQEFDNAPEFDEDMFDDAELAADWDQSHRDYWVGLVNGVSNENPQAGMNTSGLLYIEDRLFDAIDFEVENRGGEDLGEVEDLIINPDGRVSFALMETDAFLDIGDQLVAVDMQMLTWNPDEETFFLGIPESFLDQAPRVDPDDIPDITIDNWDTQWNNFWNGVRNSMPDLSIPNTGEDSGDATDMEQQEPDVTLPEPSSLVGQQVYGAYDNLLGTVVEMRGHPNDTMTYLIVDDADQDLYRPVPYSIFTDQSVDRLSIFYSAWRFNQAPGYTEIADVPTFDTQADWDRTVREYWGLPNADQ